MVDKNPASIQQMFARIAHRYDTANRVLSMRIDVLWRRRVASTLLRSPGLVLDLAAGTGDLSVDLVRIGRHRVVAADFTLEMLLARRGKMSTAPGIRPLSADGLALPLRSSSFDAVTIAFGIRNFVDPAAGLREMLRVLRPGGVVGVLEFSRPHPAIALGYRLYSRHVLPRLGGLITGSRAPYEYLPASVEQFAEGNEFLAMMRNCGFRDVTATRLTGGIVTYYRGVRP